MNAVSEMQPTVATAGSTPGALLRQEREQRGLTVQQVSEELHLDAWLVEALEQNRFLALGAPVYAKGHLRKYAVLLGLPPELILTRYQEIAEPPPPPQLPPREALLTPDPIGRAIDWRRFVPDIDWRRVHWRTYGIVGGLLVVAVALWQVTSILRASGDAGPQVVQSSTRAPVQTPSQTQAVPLTQSAPATAPAVRPESGDRPTAAGPVSRPKPEPVKVAAAKPTAAQSTSKPALQPPVQPKVAVPASVAPRVAAAKPLPTTPASAADPSPAAPAGAAPVPPPDIPQVSLRLEFAAASWAEVYDGDGRRLLYAVGDPNRPRTVSGKAPLKVTLGQAGSVQARVNGRPIAIPRRIGQESASFSVGANGSIR